MKQVAQFTALAEAGTGRRADLEQVQAEVANLESEIVAVDATESQSKQKLSARTGTGEFDEVAKARTQIAQAEADLANAKFDLEGCVQLSPAHGVAVTAAGR